MSAMTPAEEISQLCSVSALIDPNIAEPVIAVKQTDATLMI